jgi:uncharacterized membrane protein YkvI
MKNHKIWVAMLIIGICTIITGLIQLLFKNLPLCVWLTNLGLIQVIIALLQKKRDNKS